MELRPTHPGEPPNRVDGEVEPSVVKHALPLPHHVPRPERVEGKSEEGGPQHGAHALQGHLHGVDGVGGPREGRREDVVRLVEAHVQLLIHVQHAVVRIEATIV